MPTPITKTRKRLNWLVAFSLLSALTVYLLGKSFGIGLAPIYAQSMPADYAHEGRHVVLIQNTHDDDHNEQEKKNNGNDKDKKFFVHTDTICTVGESQYLAIKGEYKTRLVHHRIMKHKVDFLVVNGKGKSLSAFYQEQGFTDCKVVKVNHFWYLLFSAGVS